MALIFAAVATSGYIYFFDFYPWRKRVLSGGLNAIAQFGAIAALTVLLSGYAAGSVADPLHSVCGGLLASTVMGIYLLVCLTV